MKKANEVMIAAAEAKATPWWIFAALAAVVALACLPALSGGFLTDDYPLIVGRGTLLSSPGSLGQVVTHHLWWGAPVTGNKQDLYRPWVSATYWLEFQLGGTSPLIYHISNWLVHIANAVLVLALFLPLLGLPQALLVAGLAGLCPVALTSVGWIAERTDLWATFFALIFLISFRKAREKNSVTWLTGSLGALLMALCSKEVAVFALPVAWLLEWARPIAPPAESKRRIMVKTRPAYIYYAALLLPLVLFFAVRHQALGGSHSDLSEFVARSAPFVAEEYLRTAWHTLAPLGYAYQSDLIWSAAGQHGAGFAAVWIVFVALVAVSIVGVARRKLWAVGAAWFGLALSPAYVLGGSFAPVVDFYAYFGLAGFWLMVVDGVWTLVKRFKGDDEATARAWWYSGAGLAVVFALLTAIRLPILNSEESLWTHEANRDPHHSEAMTAIAELRFRAGDVEQGLAWAQKAQAANPSAWMPHLIQAQCLLDRGDIGAAAPHVDALAELAPGEMRAQAMIGRFYYDAGHCQEAVESYRRAFGLQEPTAEILFDYGVALLCTKENDEARDVYAAVLQLRPGWGMALNNLGICYENLGDLPHAEIAYKATTEQEPRLLAGWESLAIVYARQGKRAEAEAAADHFYSLNPPSEMAERLRATLTAAQR